jgi:hypothetical protein
VGSRAGLDAVTKRKISPIAVYFFNHVIPSTDKFTLEIPLPSSDTNPEDGRQVKE